MKKTQVARDVLRVKREKQNDINDRKRKNLKKNTMENLKKKNEELRSKIKELNNQIDFLTKLCSKYNDLLNNFFDEEGDGCDKIIYDLFRCYVNQESEFNQNIINMYLDIFNESKNSYEILKNYIPSLPTENFLKNIKKELIPNFSED